MARQGRGCRSSQNISSRRSGQAIGRPGSAARCLTQASETSLATGRIEDAAGSFREAIGIIEADANVIGGSARDLQLFFENKLDPYRGMLRLSVSPEQTCRRVRRYAERARSAGCCSMFCRIRTGDLAHRAEEAGAEFSPPHTD
ncbi:MAG: hypothetical protein IPM55_22995 [Acidobacteria bacterium]|nr:hypothetical protein [Acidobacteriota bacterium]